ncbi:hypothetical protein KL935_001633 [Ogataea polymorpha]|nr:hypothetical protein KL937_001048 [Ogataea polymorpha]KAG7902725.1 hypothetical protein KL935_001633 [Ogataea polymorpha]KAG7940107.1 hypothetical protein KL904_001045 [Ogataea polymorpha]
MTDGIWASTRRRKLPAALVEDPGSGWLLAAFGGPAEPVFASRAPPAVLSQPLHLPRATPLALPVLLT